MSSKHAVAPSCDKVLHPCVPLDKKRVEAPKRISGHTYLFLLITTPTAPRSHLRTRMPMGQLPTQGVAVLQILSPLCPCPYLGHPDPFHTLK